MSVDCKATVKLGDLSRGGMTRGDNRACDHDMEYHGKHTPCGILDEDTGQLHIEFGSSAKTSDFLVDSLQTWWNKLPAQEQQATPQIQIKMDNGPESSGVRTQFLKRMVEWVDQIQKPIHLLYFPPYHSKYNHRGALLGDLATYQFSGRLLRRINFAIRNPMGTVKKLAEEVERGLRETHPKRRKTVVSKLSLAVGAMIEGQTPNTVELANLLPLETERQDRREQGWRRLLKNPLRKGEVVMEPLARQELEEAARNGQVVVLSLDQTELGDRMAVLMVGVRVGDRSLPLAWIAEEGAANIGFEGQRTVLERVRAWLPAGAKVMLSADRFYPSAALFEWLDRHGWHYRLRLKGNLLVDPGYGDETTTGELAQAVTERYLPPVPLFAEGVLTNLGILHEAGHEEPWIIAMDGPPTRATVLDYGARWAIEIYQPCNLRKTPVMISRWWRAIARYCQRLAVIVAGPAPLYRLGSATANAPAG